MNYSLEKSSDGTTKILFKGGFHAVLIPQKGKKTTICVSSQVGCAMNCQFCYTAKMGFVRNLSKEEILNQIFAALEILEVDSQNLRTNTNSKGNIYIHDKITAIVFMGMGEPLNNFNNVILSCQELNTNYGYPLKKITVSTSGIIHQMEKFLKLDTKMALALSLHSPFQEIRDKIMPLVKQFTIKELVKVCNNYNSKRKDKIMVEYIMMKDLTDREEDLEELINLGFSKMTNINLIPLNGTMDLENKTYGSSSLQRCVEFKEKLRENGYKCFIRHTRGEDIDAACGMLQLEI